MESSSTVHAQGKALTTFTLFPELPAELRCKIWKTAAHTPRTVQIKVVNCPFLLDSASFIIPPNSSLLRNLTNTPTTLQVNHEARTETLKYYLPWFKVGSRGCGLVYANIFVDTILLRYPSLNTSFCFPHDRIPVVEIWHEVKLHNQVYQRDASWVAPGCKVRMTTMHWNAHEKGETSILEVCEAWSIISMSDLDPCNSPKDIEVTAAKAWEILDEMKANGDGANFLPQQRPGWMFSNIISWEGQVEEVKDFGSENETQVEAETLTESETQSQPTE